MTQNASTYYTTISYEAYIFIQSLHIPIGLFGIFGNTLVLTAYVKFKQLRQLDCAHLIAALSFADLISGYGNVIIGVSRLEIALFDNYDFTRLYCIATATWVLVGLEMSQAITVSIAVDRLLAVAKPLQYRAMDHRFYAIVSFALAIVHGFVRVVIQGIIGVDFGSSPVRCTWASSVHHLNTKIMVACDALSGPVIAAIYSVVVYKQRKWSKAMAEKAKQRPEKTSATIEKQAKMTKLLTILVAIYCILVALPATTIFIADQFRFAPNFIDSVLVTVFNISMGLNSSVNFILYVHSSSMLRPYLFRLLAYGKQNVDGDNMQP